MWMIGDCIKKFCQYNTHITIIVNLDGTLILGSKKMPGWTFSKAALHLDL